MFLPEIDLYANKNRKITLLISFWAIQGEPMKMSSVWNAIIVNLIKI